MKCKRCEEKAITMQSGYCKMHFISYFEEKVSFTIKKFKLFGKRDSIVVAVSGGKDSMSLLYLLNKLSYKVTALAVDEGISGYRDKTLAHMKKFCIKNEIKFKIVSFKNEFGKSLDEIVNKNKILPCSVCGVFRRRLLDIYSKGFDVLATGHNLDDEAQAVIMNLTKSNITVLGRMGPVSGSKKKIGFTKRVKPFYFCSEKEIMVYSFINRLNTEFEECPNVTHSFRLRIRDILNDMESETSGIKRRIIDSFLLLNLKSNSKKEEQMHCTYCGEPSSKDVCNACAYVKSLNTTII